MNMSEITGVLKDGNLSLNTEMSDRVVNMTNSIKSIPETAEKTVAPAALATQTALEQAGKLSDFGNI